MSHHLVVFITTRNLFGENSVKIPHSFQVPHLKVEKMIQEFKL